MFWKYVANLQENTYGFCSPVNLLNTFRTLCPKNISGGLLLKIIFFLCITVEWNKLDLVIRKCKSYTVFQNVLLKISWLNQCSIYRVHNPMRLKLFTRLRLGLSHLNEHIFNHYFRSYINPLCSCSLEIESITHFLLHCHHLSTIRSTLLNSINEVYLCIYDYLLFNDFLKTFLSTLMLMTSF